jgi:hypothetical protein
MVDKVVMNSHSLENRSLNSISSAVAADPSYLLLLLLLGTLSCIVTHLTTSKASHCAHVSTLTAALTIATFCSSSTPLLLAPNLGTLLTSTASLLLSLCPKRKLLITKNYLLLLLLSRILDCKPNLLLDEVIPHPLPCG